MSSADSRVVTMKFDNQKFKQGATETMSILAKLAASLKMPTSSKGLDDIQSKASRFNLNGVQNAVGGVSKSFLAMATVGITALANITNKAVNAGLSLAKSLTLDPIMQGFHEYETNLNSIQTVLANTKDQGTNLKDVNGALQQLNTYSDKTIYNFSEMARNIGTFTAAGVDLKTSVASIKGIANLAAISGSNSEQASTAMYQLSQAISAGRVGLQDWNSVVNAGMGGAVFQKALTRTAVAMGKLPDAAVKTIGPMKKLTVNGNSFRESIMAKPGQQSWLSSDVLTNTLKQLSGDMTNAQLKAQGFNAQQIKAIQSTAKMGVNAATKVKTLTQLMDTLKESVGSGWTKSFQIVLGNFNEAKKTWTSVSTVLGGMIQASAKARNHMLSDWKSFGGRTALLQSVANIFHAILSVMRPIQRAFHDIFPPVTGKRLAELTKNFATFTSHLTLSGKASKGLRDTFRGIFAVVGIGVDIIKNVIKYFASLIGLFLGGSGSVLTLTGSIGDLLAKFHDWLVVGGKLDGFFDKIIAGRAALLKPIIALAGKLAEALAGIITTGATKFIDWMNSLQPQARHVAELVTQFKAFAQSKALEYIDNLRAKFDEFKPTLLEIVAGVKDFASSMGENISAGFSKVNDIFNQVLGDSRNFVGNLADSISGSFDNTNSTMQKILLAIAAVAAKIRGAIGNLDLGSIFDLHGSTSATTAGIHGVSVAMDQVSKRAGVFRQIWDGVVNSVKAVAAPVWNGIKDLFNGIKNRLLDFIHGMGIEDGLAVINTGFFIAFYIMLRKFFKGISGIIESGQQTIENIGNVFDTLNSNLKVMQSDIKANIVVKIAVAIGILAASLFVLSKVPVKTLAISLGAIGVLMVALIKALGVLSGPDTEKGIGFKKAAQINLMAAAMVSMAGAVLVLSGAVAILGHMKISTLSKGLGAVTAILAIIVATTSLLAKTGGGATILAASAAMLVLAFALTAMAGAIKLFSAIKTDTIVNGGIKIAATLAALGLVMSLFPPNALLTAAAIVVIANALIIMAGAMKLMATMSVGGIIKSLIVLAGALTIMALAASAMVEALPGAAAILVMAAAIAVLVPPLAMLGKMPLGNIFKALGALAGVFVILGVAGLVLAPIVPILVALGTAILLLGGGAALAGAGMILFATGLATLAASGAAGFAVLTAGILAFAESFPLIMHQIGLGLIALGKVIAKAGPVLIQAWSVVMISLADASVKAAPHLRRAVTVLMLNGLGVLRDVMPTWVRTGFAVLMAFLRGIRDNIGKIVDVATTIYTRFLTALERNLPRLTNAATRFIIRFLNGLTNAINRNQDALSTAGVNLAIAIINGMVNGLSKFGHLAVEGAKSLAGKALHGMFSVFDSHSPSRETEKLGMYAVQGLANGLSSSGMATKSAENMAGNALSVIQATLSKIPDAIDANVDMSPTITPVLDLTQLQQDATKIGAALPSTKIAAGVSYSQASGISEARRAAAAASATAQATEVRDITFNQSITSPEPINPVKVYRNTKSQLAMAKGVLT